MSRITLYVSNIFVLIFMSFFALFGFTKNLNDLTIQNNTIEHLTFTTLMAFPDKALSPQNNNNHLYDETKITPSEFRKILEELYENNYILIDINDAYKISENNIEICDLNLSQNKKPIILSFDNVTYKSSYQNLGQVDKIIVDRNNKFATYTTKRNIQDRIMHNNEFIPILEDFISAHPEFSHNRAKGIIFLTGENGVLGYETNKKNSSAKHESKRVSEVINKLKVNGWKFGCNNYKYISDDTTTDLEFVKNINLWNKEIKPLIGDSELYAFPQGIMCNNKTKLNTLYNNGFKFFFHNSMNTNLKIENNTIYMSRKPVNGVTLRNNQKDFERLFKCEYVYDHTYRTIPYNSISL